MDAPRPIEERYLHLTDTGATSAYDAATFWPQVDRLPPANSGWLVTAFAVVDDTDHWERHPYGDEVFALSAGEIEVVLSADGPTPEERTVLTAGSSMVVPRGRWHRWIVRERGAIVVITYGRGTDHRPLN